MVKILCQMIDCMHNEEGICVAEQIKVGAEAECLTYEEAVEPKAEREDWDDDDKDLDDDWEDEDEWEEEEEEDDWGDDDDF